MRFLAIDTSTGSAAALVDADGEVLARAASADPRSHAETLAPLVDEVMRRTERIDAVVVGTGPAPFTGLRVGLVTARTMARALGVPVYGVSSLDAVARAALDSGAAEEVLVATDARRKEVYWARYRARGVDDVARLAGPEVQRPADLAGAAADVPMVAGRGAELYPDLPLTAGAPTVPDPAVLVRIARARLDLVRAGALAEADADLGVEPLYLRRPDVQMPGARKRASHA